MIRSRHRVLVGMLDGQCGEEIDGNVKNTSGRVIKWSAYIRDVSWLMILRPMHMGMGDPSVA